MPDDAPENEAGAALEIDPDQLINSTGGGDGPQLIDIRDPWETDIVAVPGATASPMVDLPRRIGRLDTSRRVILICHHGLRSAHAAIWLRQQGFKDAVSVRGGIDAYARQAEPKLPTY